MAEDAADDADDTEPGLLAAAAYLGDEDVTAPGPPAAPLGGSAPPADAEPTMGRQGRRAPAMGAVVPLLIAAVIGGLIGAGLISLVDRPAKTGANSAFGRNSSVIAQPHDIQGILERVQPGVVSIKTQAFQRGLLGDAVPASGAGTGMIITGDGDVLTNAHVVRGATSIKVTLNNEQTARDADLVGSDPSVDVAVVRIRDAKGLPTVSFGSSADLRVGDDVLAIGNALALPGGPSVTKGIVSAKDRSIGAADEQLQGLIQTDAAINPGNSGGPLVNANGEVVGMNTAVIQSTGEALAQNIGFAIAVDNIKTLIQRLEKGSAAVTGTTAFLGVSTTTMTPAIKEANGFTVDKGAVVQEVVPGSPAENAGLVVGDVITKFGDQKIETNDQLVAAVRTRKPGDKIEITFTRGKDQKKTTATIGSRPGGVGN
ncbi:MAG TPA: trypsin-like peptidase domain-containing protein [Acidimicrobiales bacterium]|nr:trypsin-like peptidase domain-containing protein [Acidimicrobiales bacterium]